MENKKYVLILVLIIAFLGMMVSTVQATDDQPLTIVTNVEEENNTANAQNEDTTAPIITSPTGNTANTANTTNNTEATNTLPQTGIAEDTALFVFIAVCVVSAIYAFIKVRNYKNI